MADPLPSVPVLRPRLVLLAVLAALTVPASLAPAGIETQVLHAYQSRGSVPPCEFTSSQLEHALAGIDTYGAQYFQDFSSAVQAALTARVGGACARAGSGASAVSGSAAGAAPTVPPAGPSAPLHLGPVGAPTSAAIPAPLLLLGAFAACAAILGAGALVLRRRPDRAAGWRHAWAELVYRGEGLRAALADRRRDRTAG